MHQICGECRQAIELILRPAEFDRYVVAVDKPRFLQAIPECRYPVNGFDSSRGVKEANDRHRRLLRARRERPSGGAAEQRDELATSHVEHGASSTRVGATNTQLASSSRLVGLPHSQTAKGRPEGPWAKP